MSSPNRQSFLTKTLGIGLAALGLTSLTAANSSNWIRPGDSLARLHYQQLVDANVISGLITTWPLPVEQVIQQLQAVDLQGLSPEQAKQVTQLQTQLTLSNQNATNIRYGNSVEPLRGFSSQSRESGELTVSLVPNAEVFNGHFSASYVDDPLDGHEWRLDDSYLAFDWSNWRIGVGRIDRWWGPGWQSSMILSNNARPSPGIFIKRTNDQAFGLPVLKWLGPWSAQVFANQLEEDRFVPKSKLLGARVTLKPFSNLEIGLSRTAQWGGEGRPETLSNLWDLIIGNDNRGSGGIDLDGSNEPGNQLGGVDFRFSGKLFEQSFALYGQLIGEDEAGSLPSREIGLVGLEIPLRWGENAGTLFLEASESTMNFLNNEMPNSAYNHSIYRSGYRYYGQSIGASSDNDSRTYTLGGVHAIGDRGSVTWKLIHADLNKDGVAANNTVAPTAIDTDYASVEYSNQLNEQLSFSLLGYHLTEEIAPALDIEQSGIQISFTFRQ